MRTAINLAGPALRGFFNIARAWSLSEAEQMKLLGIASRTTLKSWRKKAKDDAAVSLRRDTLERISYVFGIFKAINVLLPETRLADAWVRLPNRANVFCGRSALDRMTAGNVSDLYVVRHYLDAQLYGS